MQRHLVPPPVEVRVMHMTVYEGVRVAGRDRQLPGDLVVVLAVWEMAQLNGMPLEPGKVVQDGIVLIYGIERIEIVEELGTVVEARIVVPDDEVDPIAIDPVEDGEVAVRRITDDPQLVVLPDDSVNRRDNLVVMAGRIAGLGVR